MAYVKPLLKLNKYCNLSHKSWCCDKKLATSILELLILKFFCLQNNWLADCCDCSWSALGKRFPESIESLGVIVFYWRFFNFCEPFWLNLLSLLVIILKLGLPHLHSSKTTLINTFVGQFTLKFVSELVQLRQHMGHINT